MFDWNLVRSFLAVADAGTLSAAADHLGASQPTVGRHIDELERQTGLTLFARGRTGMALTEAGLSLIEDARAMAAEADRFALRAAGRSASVSGPVRITASDVVATFLLPPILVALKDAEPDIDIELVPSNTVQNLLSRDADIAVRMVRPTQNDIIARKTNDFAMGAYARTDYLDRHGRPVAWQDILNHRLVGYDRDDFMLRGMERMGIAGVRENFTFRTDDQVAYMELVKAGAGIGFGPRFILSQVTGLERIFPDLPIPSLPMWLATHQELKTNLRIRRAADFLHASLHALPLSK